MQGPIPATATEELHAALLQAVLTAAVALLCAFLYQRYHKAYFAWWAGAWMLYVVRIGAIIELPPDRELDLALLASGNHRLDRARLVIRGSRFCSGGPLASVVSRAGALPAHLVIRRHLPPRSVSLGRRARGSLSEPCHARHGVGVLSISAASRLEWRHAVGRRVRPLGSAPSRLPLPQGARSLDAVGILPRYRVHSGHRCGDSPPRAR